MARIFIIVVMLYIIMVTFFAVINISLVFLKSKSISYVVRSIVIFSLFPILVFTKDGRKQLQKVINF